MGTVIPLARLEEIIDASGVAPAIEAMLPAGVRQRQLHPRTLLVGMQLALTDRRPAHLTEVHAALTSLPRADQERLGVTADPRGRPHRLTYRQVEHTHRIINRALAKDQPDGAPSPHLQQVCDQLTEASIPEAFKNTSTSLAADWTDVEAWARPVPHEAAGTGTDPEASWGHRNVGRSVQEGEMFFGYYLSAAVMVADENGEPVPELARRITVASPGHDPAAELAGVLTTMPAGGIALGDILADSGYSHRVPATWAQPLRAAGADLVVDLHPHDRGPRGTHHGAIIANGNLYCPATPGPLLELVPLPPGAAADVAAHDQKTAELARYKLGVHAAADADGYRRHACPAAAGKIRCPLRPASLRLDRSRPEVLTPPEHPPACCTQQTITAGPGVAPKTRQKHDYPSQAWRLSYRRRTAAERLNAAIKDSAVNSIDRGWIRLTGVTPLMLWLACLMVVRNQRTLHAFAARQQDNTRRAAASGQQPRARNRRRELAGAPAGPP
ncbi:MAG: hypothetical protein ACRDNT_21245 [Streptosporangiaceae bacterium]